MRPSSAATTGFTLSSVPTAPAAANRRPPLRQVFQRLEQADDDHAVTNGLDGRRNLGRTTALVHQAACLLNQHALAQGHVIAVHNEHVAARRLGKCGTGALIGAQLGAHGNNHGLVAGLLLAIACEKAYGLT